MNDLTKLRNKIRKLRNSRNYYKTLYNLYKEFMKHSCILLENYCKPEMIKQNNTKMYEHIKKIKRLIKSIKNIEKREELLKKLKASLEED